MLCFLTYISLHVCMYLPAALDLDVEDINAYLQRQDALALLKRMPTAPSRVTELPTDTDTAIDASNSTVAPGTAAGVA